jgi:hypothetical protein
MSPGAFKLRVDGLMSLTGLSFFMGYRAGAGVRGDHPNPIKPINASLKRCTEHPPNKDEVIPDVCAKKTRV